MLAKLGGRGPHAAGGLLQADGDADQLYRPDLGVLKVYDIVVRHNLGVISERFIVVQLGPSQVMLAQKSPPTRRAVFWAKASRMMGISTWLFSLVRLGLESKRGSNSRSSRSRTWQRVCQSRLSCRNPRQSHPPSLAW